MSELDLITCIVQRGEADRVVKSALTKGAQGATYFYARGTGVRQKLGILGSLIEPEKEVVFVVTGAENTDTVFDAMVTAGDLLNPGKGFAFVQPVRKAVGLLER